MLSFSLRVKPHFNLQSRRVVSDLGCSRTDDLLGGPERGREAQPRRRNTKIGGDRVLGRGAEIQA